MFAGLCYFEVGETAVNMNDSGTVERLRREGETELLS